MTPKSETHLVLAQYASLVAGVESRIVHREEISLAGSEPRITFSSGKEV